MVNPEKNESKALPPIGEARTLLTSGPRAMTERARREDEQRRAAALKRIRLATAFAMERTQAINDAVRLAAEQVQDVRLAGLDKSTQVSAMDVLLPILIAMTSEAALAGAVVAGATSIVYGGIAKLHRARAMTEAVGMGLGTYAAEQLAGVAGASKRFEVIAKAVESHKATKVAIELIKQGRRVLAAASTGMPMAEDTAGVAIQDAAASCASDQRLLIAALYAQLEEKVVAGIATQKEIDEATAFHPLDDLGTLRKRYRLFFEAVIWAVLWRFGHPDGASITLFRDRRLVGNAAKGLERQVEELKIRFYTGKTNFFGSPEDGPPTLLQYLTERLIDPNTGKAFAKGRYEPIKRQPDTDVFREGDALTPAMVELGKHLDKLGKTYLEIGAGALVVEAIQPSGRSH